MSAQGTLTVKKQAGGENRFNEEIDAIRSNLGEFRTNRNLLGDPVVDFCFSADRALLPLLYLNGSFFLQEIIGTPRL